MSIVFDYKLNAEWPGWAIVSFGNGSQQLHIEIEYGEDYLGKFARVAAAVCGAFVNTTVVLEQIPKGGYACNFWNDGDQLSIKIRKLDALDNYTQMHQGAILFEASGGRHAFAVEVTCAMDRIYREMGLCGYIKKWYTNEFPLYQYFHLRMLLDRSPLVHQIASVVRAGRSAAALELQLLLAAPDLDERGSGIDIPLAAYDHDPNEESGEQQRQ